MNDEEDQIVWRYRCKSGPRHGFVSGAYCQKCQNMIPKNPFTMPVCNDCLAKAGA